MTGYDSRPDSPALQRAVRSLRRLASLAVEPGVFAASGVGGDGVVIDATAVTEAGGTPFGAPVPARFGPPVHAPFDAPVPFGPPIPPPFVPAGFAPVPVPVDAPVPFDAPIAPFDTPIPFDAPVPTPLAATPSLEKAPLGPPFAGFDAPEAKP